jgi:hypothetical protein
MAVLAAGCGDDGGGDESSDAADTVASQVTAAAGGEEAPAEDRDGSGGGGAVGPGDGGGDDAMGGAPGEPTFVADPLSGRSIVFTATIVLRSEDVPGDVTRAGQIARDAGGALFASEVSLEGTPSATLVVRVPPEQLAATLDELSTLGGVLALTQDAQDVTTQVVDLDSRIATARVSVERLRAFLSDATSAADVAALEAELLRRETELEQLVAQQRALADQVALATITVELRSAETAAPLGPVAATVDADLGPLDALRDGLSSVASVGFGILLVLAWSLPFLVVAAVVLVPAGLIWRRRRSRPSPTVDPPPEPPAPGPAEALAGAADA